jgi:hypothetical protein
MPVVIERKPKEKYVSPIKEYTISYDAIIRVSQNGLQPIIPHNIKANKKNFIGQSREQVLEKLNKVIKEAIIEKCSFIKEVISIDNIKFDNNLIEE